MAPLMDDTIVVTAPRYRQINEEGLAQITKSESLRLLAYDDLQPKRTHFANVGQIRGTPTIGYGHIRTVSALDVVEGKRITKEEAMRLKRADLQMTYRKIEAVIGRKRVWELSDNQYAALVSFTFNCGLSPNWTISKYLKAGRFDEVPDQMVRFVFSKGKRLRGLVIRRREEVDLWRKDETLDVTAAQATGVDVEVQPSKRVLTSRTVKASLLAGLSSLGAGATAAIPIVSPHTGNSDYLNILLVACVAIAGVSSFVAAAMRAADQKGATA